MDNKMELLETISKQEIQINKLQNLKFNLREEKEKYETLISNIPGVVYRCKFDKSWKVYFISNGIEDLSGYPATDFIGSDIHTYSIVIHPEDKTRVEKNVFDAVEKKEPFTIRYRITDSENIIHWVYEKGQAVFDENNIVQYLDGVIFDISDIKKQEDEKDRLIKELQSALDNVKTLSGLLPFCTKCKKIRDDTGCWNEVEKYIEKYSDALLTDALCPSCKIDFYENHNSHI